LRSGNEGEGSVEDGREDKYILYLETYEPTPTGSFKFMKETALLDSQDEPFHFELLMQSTEGFSSLSLCTNGQIVIMQTTSNAIIFNAKSGLRVKQTICDG